MIIGNYIGYYTQGGASVPELQSATVTQTTTNVLDLVFDIAVDITITGWTIASDGDAITITSVIAGDGTTAPKFSLSRVVVPGEVLTVSYNAATGDTAASTGGGLLASITDQVITNDVHILLEVNFTGTTVDTSKGTITNPDSANLLVNQNDVIRFTRVTDVLVGTFNNLWASVDTFTRGVFRGTLSLETGFANSALQFSWRVDTDNRISIANLGGTLRLGIVIAGVNQYSLDTGVATGTNHPVKIIYEANNDIKFYEFTAGAWAQLGTTQNFNVGVSAPVAIASTSSSSDVAGDKGTFDDLRVTDEDYTTSLPEDYFL